MSAGAPAAAPAAAAAPPPIEKAAVEDLLEAMDGFVPTIPEEVTRFYLRQTGFQTPDDRLVKLVSLAAQKFAADVAQEAVQRCKWRRDGMRAKDRADDKRLVLTAEDLAEALKDRGVSIAKPLFYYDGGAGRGEP